MTPVMQIDPSGNFAISIFIGSIVVGALLGGALGGYTATQNGAELWSESYWIGVGTGAFIGGSVGAVAGWSFAGGSALFLKGGLSSVANKIISDSVSSNFHGAINFGSWEDYAVAFVIGGLIKGKGAEGLLKWGLDSFARPGLNQLMKMGTRGANFNFAKFGYDVFTRTLTSRIDEKVNLLGLELDPLKAIIRGSLSGFGKIIYD